MRNYEFTVILDQNDDKMAEGLKFVLATFEKNGVEITKQDDMGVKTLAYLINKQEKGHYVYFELSADPSKIAKISHEFQLSTLVLKFLFVNPEK
ncbi:MAG: 30S ribosomal protein S6 [Spirochaetales bacterium]|nr:30S ribosomal protein S6 [Spirochaetales bacterium]